MAERIIQLIKELKQADALRRELVTNITHDLRTPLTSLQGYLETLILKQGELKPEEEHDYLAIAIKHSHQLGRLVSQLFELAKLDSPDVQVHLESFCLDELIEDIVQKFQLSVEKKRIKLQTNSAEHLPMVFADIGLIERVFENLIENAIRYTPENGSITITVVPDGDKLVVKVADTGSGIRPEYIPNLFDRSYRVKREYPGDGTGLGLPISKRILELHQSGIEVESEVDVGTTFTYTLPIYNSASCPAVRV
jgi:signal transduction histidine kinase